MKKGNKLMRGIFIVLMLSCLIYAVSIYMIGSGTFSFMIWICGAVFFAAAFYLSGNGRWYRIPFMIRGLCCGVISLLLIIAAVCLTLMLSRFNDKGVKDLDYIIVLGAQMRNDGPSTIFRYRLDAAYDYLTENPDTICIVSGGHGANEPVCEGNGGREYLISRGVEASRVIAENKAMDTSENILYSLDLIDRGSAGSDKLKIGIVTNNFHLFRGVHLAKKLTDNNIYGIAAYTLPWYLPNNMARECFGIVRDSGKMRF
jgi:uncharacterized SAM-binding protein YcdF (DUF218 family)